MDKFPARRQWNSRQAKLNALHKSASAASPCFATRSGTAQAGINFPDRVAVLGPPEAGARRAGAGGNRRVLRDGAECCSEADKLFQLRLVERSAQVVLAEKLKDVNYDPITCRDMSPDVASAILDKVQSFSLKQYKLVCVVSLGSLREKPGVQFGSRCLWNKDTDNFLNVKYSNGSLYAVALIFGLYFE